MRNMLILLADALIFVLSALGALMLCLGPGQLVSLQEEIFPYIATGFIVSLIVFFSLGIHNHFFRYFSLYEFKKITFSIVLALLISVAIAFSYFPLQGIPHTLPIIQGFVALGGIAGLRLFGRWLGKRRERLLQQWNSLKKERRGVLIIGFTPVAEIYLRSTELFDSENIVIGILDEDSQFRGRRLRETEVLGKPEELPHILNQLQIHGVSVCKLVIATPYASLSKTSRQIIDEMKRRKSIQVDDFHSLLDTCITHGPASPHVSSHEEQKDIISVPKGLEQAIERRMAEYGRLKHNVDFIVAVLMGLLALPVFLLAVSAVWLTMGRPIFFWQERPGQGGRMIRIYKLRTLKDGVDQNGRVLTDSERQTPVGKLLRRLHIDELPQLYNILRGDLSLVGPRPLLPVDLPEDMPSWIHLRRLGRPGLTGWAQVHGGQALEKHLKVILDVWYLTRQSPALDLKILWLTAVGLVRSKKEIVRLEPVEQACRDLGISPEQLRHFDLLEPDRDAQTKAVIAEGSAPEERLNA